MRPLLSILMVLPLIQAVLIEDIKWCDMDGCKVKKQHTICKWGIYCPPNAHCESTTYFNKEMKDYLIELHNKKRNLIALGEEKRVPEKVHKAADMNVLQWHVHLEYVARCHCRQCDFSHDDCRSVPDFPKVGQNIYMKSFSKKNPEDVNIKSVVEQAVEAWYEEIDNIPEENYQKWKKTEKPSGHYTQMIWAKSTHVGCGLSDSKDQKDLKYYLVCNYGTQGNINEKPIYTVGEPCSKCPEGVQCNPDLKGLCGEVKELALRCPCEAGKRSVHSEGESE